MNPLQVSRKKRLLIVSAEASSNAYAVELLKKIDKDSVYSYGIGDVQMRQHGFDSLVPSESLAVMGIVEVLKKIKFIKNAFDLILKSIDREKPDLVLLMDYPGFNVKLAEKIKAKYNDIPIYYFILPKAWAWKKKRVQKLIKYCDKCFSILPFEESFFSSLGLKTQYVGNPLVAQYKQSVKIFDIELEKEKRSLRNQDYILGLMPGSRESEVKSHIQIQLETAITLKKSIQNLRVLILLAPHFNKEDVLKCLPSHLLQNIDCQFIKLDSFGMIRICDGLIVASGTATLQVGICKKPMVIMYKVNPITAWIGKRLVKGIKYFGLVNLVLDKKVAPEFMQGEAKAPVLARAFLEIYLDQAYIGDMDQLEKHLGDLDSFDMLNQEVSTILGLV